MTFDLAADSTVQFIAGGSQLAVSFDGGAQQTCHAGYRFTVDGIARGEADYGQALVVNSLSVAPGNDTGTWWARWDLRDFASMSAGTHTVEVDGNPFGWNNSIGCWICEDQGFLSGNSDCQLHVLAVPK